jgi:hypothetical protein
VAAADCPQVAPKQWIIVYTIPANGELKALGAAQ